MLPQMYTQALELFFVFLLLALKELRPKIKSPKLKWHLKGSSPKKRRRFSKIALKWI